MAGQYEADLCRVILEERFGVSVGLVMGTLLREPSSLSGLVHSLRGKLSPTIIKKAMAVLEQFNILKFKMDGNNRIGYSVDHEAVTALLKAPRCGMLLQKLHGKGLEIFLCLLNNGRLSCSEVIRKMVHNSGSADEPNKIKELFDRLVEAQFLVRCPTVDHTHHGCPHFQTTSEVLYVLPEKIATNFSSSDEDVNSRKRKHADSDPDSEILWRVNFQRFDRYFRDEIIQEMVVPQNWTGDEKTSKTCRQTLLALFKANETRSGNMVATSSNPISVYDIAKCSKDHNLGVEKTDIDWALRVLVEDARGVIRKAGDSGGGLYVIDFDRAIRLSCQHHVECLIREQLDTKAVRVFRLLQSKGYLEEEQVEKMTMMSPKETRELLFAMQEEGYVFTKPIGKTQDFAPARTFYLYYVDLTKIVRGVMEYTCKSLRNLILRRKQEFLENRWLIEKRSTMQNIIDETEADPDKDEATKQEEIADVRETYMPAANMAKYKKFEDARDLLDKAEAETERVLLTLRLHLLLSKQPSPL